MKAYLLKEERSPLNPKKIFGAKGSMVTVVNQNGKIAIVADSHGNRFPVKTENLQFIKN